MVARGDLGIELPIEDVPLVQKRLLRLAGELARPSITATQMLDSMVASSRPTRAEVDRRRQRDPRRHRRGDALPGDRGRRLPGRGGRDDGRDRRAHRARRCPTAEWNEDRVRRDARDPAYTIAYSACAAARELTSTRSSCRRCRAARRG
jgi:pyruvate kinase